MSDEFNSSNKFNILNQLEFATVQARIAQLMRNLYEEKSWTPKAVLAALDLRLEDMAGTKLSGWDLTEFPTSELENRGLDLRNTKLEKPLPEGCWLDLSAVTEFYKWTEDNAEHAASVEKGRLASTETPIPDPSASRKLQSESWGSEVVHENFGLVLVGDKLYIREENKVRWTGKDYKFPPTRNIYGIGSSIIIQTEKNELYFFDSDRNYSLAFSSFHKVEIIGISPEQHNMELVPVRDEFGIVLDNLIGVKTHDSIFFAEYDPEEHTMQIRREDEISDIRYLGLGNYLVLQGNNIGIVRFSEAGTYIHRGRDNRSYVDFESNTLEIMHREFSEEVRIAGVSFLSSIANIGDDPLMLFEEQIKDPEDLRIKIVKQKLWRGAALMLGGNRIVNVNFAKSVSRRLPFFAFEAVPYGKTDSDARFLACFHKHGFVTLWDERLNYIAGMKAPGFGLRQRSHAAVRTIKNNHVFSFPLYKLL